VERAEQGSWERERGSNTYRDDVICVVEEGWIYLTPDCISLA